MVVDKVFAVNKRRIVDSLLRRAFLQKTFGNLTVISLSHIDDNSNVMMDIQCKCGRMLKCSIQNLVKKKQPRKMCRQCYYDSLRLIINGVDWSKSTSAKKLNYQLKKERYFQSAKDWVEYLISLCPSLTPTSSFTCKRIDKTKKFAPNNIEIRLKHSLKDERTTNDVQR